MIHKFKCQLFEVIIDDVEMTIENPYLVDRLIGKGNFHRGRYFSFASAGGLGISVPILFFKGYIKEADNFTIAIPTREILNCLLYDLSECCKKYPLKSEYCKKYPLKNKSHLPKWF